MLGKKIVTLSALVIMLSAVLLLGACGGGGGGTNGGILGPPPVADKTATPDANFIHIGWGAQTGLNIWGDPGAVEANAYVYLTSQAGLTDQFAASADGSFTREVNLVNLQASVGETLYVTAEAFDKDEVSDALLVTIPAM